MNDANVKDSVLILILAVFAGITIFVTVLLATLGVVATVFIQEGVAAFFFAMVASLLCLVGGLAVVVFAAIIAAFTKRGLVRIYSIALCALFLVVIFLINASAYGWFFFDPVKRAEYEAEETVYSEGAGRLFENQLDDQTDNNATSSGYFAWRMERGWGWAETRTYSIKGAKNGIPIFISASNYGDETWDINISTNAYIPDIEKEDGYVFSDDWRVSDGRIEYIEPYGDEWIDLAEQEPYFENDNRIRAVNELIMDERIDFLLAGARPSISYNLAEEGLGAAAEHKRLARHIELIAELYPREGTWEPRLCVVG